MTTETLTAHAVDTPARYVVTGLSDLPDRFGGTPAALPEPLASIDWRTLATFTAHAVDIIDVARERWERCQADRIDVGSVVDVARSLVDRVAGQADRLAREQHTWWHGHRTGGDTDKVTAPPDEYARVRSTSTARRTNSGATEHKVSVHGRAYVGGDHRAQRSTALSMTPDRLAHAIATAPRTASGFVDAFALARLADVAYPDLPDLIGGDLIAFHEWRAHDDTLARQARRGWPTRYRLPKVTARTGEPPTRGTGPLLAPADHGPDYAWHGHRLARRPLTVRARRARQAYRIDESVSVPESADLAAALAHVARLAPTAPHRARWTWRGESGFVTVSGTPDRRRYAVSGLPGGQAVRGYRTADGMGRAVANLTA